jgi:hypothetical protein
MSVGVRWWLCSRSGRGTDMMFQMRAVTWGRDEWGSAGSPSLSIV